MQRLELLDQRPQVLAHLYLSEEDADRSVRVDEEVCTLSAGVNVTSQQLPQRCAHLGDRATPDREDQATARAGRRGLNSSAKINSKLNAELNRTVGKNY